MNLMTSAGPAELFHLYLAGSGLFVFSGAVILTFALSTLQMNNVTHGKNPLSWFLIQ